LLSTVGKAGCECIVHRVPFRRERLGSRKCCGAVVGQPDGRKGMHRRSIDANVSTGHQEIVVTLNVDPMHDNVRAVRQSKPTWVDAKSTLDKEGHNVAQHRLAQAVGRCDRFCVHHGQRWGGLWWWDWLRVHHREDWLFEGCFIVHQRRERIEHLGRGSRCVVLHEQSKQVIVLSRRGALHRGNTKFCENIDVVVHGRDAVRQAYQPRPSTFNRMTTVARRALLVCIILMLVPGGASFPSGVGEVANEGCRCHGAQDDTLALTLDGVPEVYTPGMIYALSFNGHGSHEGNGGFRLLVDDGTLRLSNGSGTQVLDGGVTHTAPASSTTGWNLTWTAPEAVDEAAHFVLHINHVNGDGSSGGDRWTTLEVWSLGPEAVKEPAESSSHLSTFGAEAFALVALAGLLLMTRLALTSGGKA